MDSQGGTTHSEEKGKGVGRIVGGRDPEGGSELDAK